MGRKIILSPGEHNYPFRVECWEDGKLLHICEGNSQEEVLRFAEEYFQFLNPKQQ